MNLRHLFSILRYPRLFLYAKIYGNNIRIGKGGLFAHHKEISFGSNIYIGPNFHISAHNLKFGSNILIGPNFLLEGEDHVFNLPGKTIWSTRKQKEIGFNTIEDDVWIGGNVIVLKNVIIGEGCIIGAGSVITKNLPPYSICVGIPCVPIKLRFSENDLEIHLNQVKSKYSKTLVLKYFNNSYK